MILVDGLPVEPHAAASIVETEPGVYSILADGASYEVRVGEVTATGGQVVVNGHRFGFELDDPRHWKPSRNAAGVQSRISIVAPMPGKVVRLLAAEGDEVAAGQGIVVVEAMKMQNELKSPRAGRVTSVSVRESDSVAAGAILATIE